MSENKVYVGPFLFEGAAEFGGCTSGRGASHGTELFGDPKFGIDVTDDEGVMAENLFGSDFGSDLVGHNPNDDAHNFWIDASEGCATIEDILEIYDDEDEDFDDDELEMTSSLYPSDHYVSNVCATRFFTDSDMQSARRETVRGRRQKHMTEVRVRGNNHPRRCRVFLAWKAGKLAKPTVRSGTLHLHHA